MISRKARAIGAVAGALLIAGTGVVQLSRGVDASTSLLLSLAGFGMAFGVWDQHVSGE